MDIDPRLAYYLFGAFSAVVTVGLVVQVQARQKYGLRFNEAVRKFFS